MKITLIKNATNFSTDIVFMTFCVVNYKSIPWYSRRRYEYVLSECDDMEVSRPLRHDISGGTSSQLLPLNTSMSALSNLI